MLQLICGILFLVFLAPATAQEDQLIGAWELRENDEEGEFVTWIIAKPEGEFEIRGEGRPSGDFFGSFEDEETLGFDIFPDVELMTINATGVWRATGDSLYLDVKEVDFVLDGLSAEEFFIQIAKNFARNLANMNDIPDAAYPAFEEEVVNQFLENFDLGELSEILDEEGTYTLDGDVLTLTTTDENGLVETDDYRRVPLSSAVSATSWGRLKENWGR